MIFAARAPAGGAEAWGPSGFRPAAGRRSRWAAVCFFAARGRFGNRRYEGLLGRRGSGWTAVRAPALRY